MFHLFSVFTVGILLPIISTAQEPLSETTLRGTWFVSGSAIKESVNFLPGNEFTTAHTQTMKDGKKIPPFVRTGEGAYKIAAGACSVGQEMGNLWMVKETQRCCFVAYRMGNMLVLDEIQGKNSFPLSLCSSKTLKRKSDKTAD